MSICDSSEKLQHEAAAEKALKAKDNEKAFFHVAKAAECAYKLAEKHHRQGEYKLALAYLNNAEGLLESASVLKKKCRKRGKNSSSGGNESTAADGETKDVGLLMERPDIRLSDVAGMDEVKEQIRLRLIEPLKNGEEARRHGLKVGGGLLMYGPPGTGKTFLAKAVAGELQLPFYVITAADILSKFVGESQQNIRRIFSDVRKNPLSIIFIDEAADVFGKRSENMHETTRQVISIILQELDGFKSGSNPVMLLAATNHPWDIDEAFMRVGRFDERVYVGLPDLPARKKIVENAFKEVSYPVEPGVFDFVAERTEGLNGADISGLVQKIRQAAYSRHAEIYTRELAGEFLQNVTPSCSAATIREIEEWEKLNKIQR